MIKKRKRTQYKLFLIIADGKLVALISTWAAGGIADTTLTPAALVLRKAICFLATNSR